jgi:hypothetical protein
VRNNVNNHCGRPVQHSTVHQIPRSEPTEQDNIDRKPTPTFEKDHSNSLMNANTNINVSDEVKHNDHDTTQHIPITVNGEVIETMIVKENYSIRVIMELRRIL